MSELTPEVLAGFFGVALSLVFTYVPKAREWYEAKDSIAKAQIMLAFMFGAVAILFGLSCFGVSFYGVACTTVGAVDLLKLLFVAASGNQITYLMVSSPKAKAAK